MSLALHIVNVLLLFLVLLRLTGSLWPSALAAALFAVHPLNVESVAWIAERKNLLSLLFGLVAIWFYTDYTRNDQGRWTYYALAWVGLAMSLMSKPMLVTLPFVLLLLDVWPLERASWPWNLASAKALTKYARSCAICAQQGSTS